jgi:hypothetical protein
MEISSNPKDQQLISKLGEDFQVASKIRKAGESARSGLGNFKSSSGNGSFSLPPENERVFSNSVRLSAPLSKWSSEIQAAPSCSPPEGKLSDGKYACSTLEGPASSNEQWRRQSSGGSERARDARSDGENIEEGPLRAFSPGCHREGAPRPKKGNVAISGRSSHPQVLTLNSSPPSCFPESFLVVAGKETSSEARVVVAERKPARRESLDRRQDPNERQHSGSRPVPSKDNPSNPALSMHPSNGPRSITPSRVDLQGPSPVDQNFVLEADFPKEMVLEMQGAAAKKARRTVIGRTLGGEPPSSLSMNA